MAFAAGLRKSLETRDGQVLAEFTRGDSLEHVLSRHLTTVEQNFDGELITSILLLSADRKRLSHGAGPSLPKAYRDAIDGSEIGPRAGSCGTAAFFGRPVYVADIATDPLWSDYRHLALQHGLRSCWSNPIRDTAGEIIGTFAIYHRIVGAPVKDEMDAIDLITGHVSSAILWARGVQDVTGPNAVPARMPPRLKLVESAENLNGVGWPDRMLSHLGKLEALMAALDRHSDTAESKAAAADIRKLIQAIRQQVERKSAN
jgi:hypothetical protein